ncbi:MAG: ion transporter [Fibrobacterota bacterium]|nr:ion transporter [Fibrobacterota bacterium]
MRETQEDREALEGERATFLAQLESAFETPMAILGFVWLGLLVAELLGRLPPVLEAAGMAIWVLFILDFGIKFAVAPRKIPFLRSNILTMISLVLPALRIFRAVRLLNVIRTARAARGLRLVRIFGSLNRGMRSLGASMGRRGFGYVLALSLLVLMGGSAGIYAFEGGTSAGLKDFGEALWWTAMILTTMGSGFWPITPEGRILCVLLSLYSFAVFGYFTAALATFFVGRDAEEESGEIAGAQQVGILRKELQSVLDEIRALRREKD